MVGIFVRSEWLQPVSRAVWCRFSKSQTPQFQGWWVWNHSFPCRPYEGSSADWRRLNKVRYTCVLYANHVKEAKLTSWCFHRDFLWETVNRVMPTWWITEKYDKIWFDLKKRCHFRGSESKLKKEALKKWSIPQSVTLSRSKNSKLLVWQ